MVGGGVGHQGGSMSALGVGNRGVDGGERVEGGGGRGRLVTWVVREKSVGG